ncbi:hypothetical protein pb186bvf_000545 [Paramecium bursaria]
MGSQCCKGNTQPQDELVIGQKDTVQGTPNAPIHKISLSQQGSKRSQVEELNNPPQDMVNYQDQPAHSLNTYKDQINELQQAPEEQEDAFDPSPKNDCKSHKSRKLLIGPEIFVKLKEGSINNYYSLGKVLGQGAFGKVWRVTHKTTGLVRAMKQLKKQSLIKEEEQRLFSEMNILKNLDHPHIVKLFELYQDDGSYYLVTEYLQGGELFDRIKKMNYFSENKAADYIKQILTAVLYCHDQNIVHRDLKPENIIFVNEEQDSQLKVIDFGTSRKFDGLKQMSKRLGTPYYIAPEVLNHQYNEKCDIWSCGVILYILLCGYPPFVAKTENQILEKVKLGRFQFDPDDWDSISKEAKTLITKMLHMDPNKRLSAKQVLEDPWIQKFAPTQQINLKVLNNLRQFQAQTILKQALMSFIITQMSTNKDIEDLKNTFKGLDVNNDGYLSKAELMQGLANVTADKQLLEEEVKRILDLADLNQSGQIDFSEFCMAAMNQEKLLSVQKVEQAFKIFDQNSDGFISKQELENIMGDLEDDIWHQILQDCDQNNDGKISYEEFTKMLLSKA